MSRLFASFSLFRGMSGTCLGTCFDYFWKIVLKQAEISKTNETLPDHFSIKEKASHEVERQIGRFWFSLDLFRKVLLNYIRQPYVS